MSRRVVLVASGGLTLGIAATLGWPSGGLTGGALGNETSGAGRPSPGGTVARSSPRASRPRATSTEAPSHPATHPKAKRAGLVTHETPPAGPVYYLDDGPRTIALTIDDGPSPVYTPQILQILERHHVTASFSMVGQNVTYYPGLVRDVADAGHVIVNHTWDHANLALLRASQARTEIARASDAIHAAVGERPRIFRAPYGAWSKATLEYCASEKLMPLDWSVDPRDWSRPGVGEIVTNILRNTRTGSIILEHDGGGNRSQTVAALRTVIPRLLAEGYRFRTP